MSDLTVDRRTDRQTVANNNTNGKSKPCFEPGFIPSPAECINKNKVKGETDELLGSKTFSILPSTKLRGLIAKRVVRSVWK